MSAKISGSRHADEVKEFVSHGGVLIRFAGERMTSGSRRAGAGARCAPAAAIWAAPWPGARRSIWRLSAPQSPFNGLEIAVEVTVSRQILAEPVAELSNRTWAQLADGTPLITAQAMGSGWIVLFHITASPGWSSLPLSGLYVDMLKRLLALSAGTPARELAGLTSLPPVSLLDGFGHADAADARYRADRRRSDFAQTRVSPQHPPGLYGAHEVESALNVMRAGDRLSPLADGGIAGLWQRPCPARWSPICWRPPCCCCCWMRCCRCGCAASPRAS